MLDGAFWPAALVECKSSQKMVVIGQLQLALSFVSVQQCLAGIFLCICASVPGSLVYIRVCACQSNSFPF